MLFRGSLRDPLFYLTAGAIVLLGALAFAPLSFNSANDQRIGNMALIKVFGASSENNPSFQGNEGFAVPGAQVKESPDLYLVQKNSLLAATPPVMVTPQILGSLMDGSSPEDANREITEYVVEKDDTLWSIAQRFDVSLDTIVWANNIKSQIISPGQKLLILPASGVMHMVKSGDTIKGIAESYSADEEKIIVFNDLSGDGDIFAGEILIVPGGRMPSYRQETQAVAAPTSLSTNNFYGQSHNFPFGQCTWWVAQKRAIPAWGNANSWLTNAKAEGYSVCQGRYCVPRAGAVISLLGDRTYGHVGYVEQVKGDKVIFSEMNYIGWGKMDYRTLRVGSPQIIGYIY